MTSEEFLEFHKKFLNDCHEICKKKNSDYTGSNNAFDNFENAILAFPNAKTHAFLRMNFSESGNNFYTAIVGI